MTCICTLSPPAPRRATLDLMASSITQDVVVLNDFGGGVFERRSRTTGAGTKDRYTCTIKAEPILHDFNTLRLGRLPAEAIRDLVRRQIKAIGDFAALATREKRERAVGALERGARWAQRRYSGGRTGTTAPNTSGRKFNDSGRLADGLELREVRTGEGEDSKADHWVMNVPANRLNPAPGGVREFTDAAFDAMIQEIYRLVPALRGGEEVLNDEGVRRAIATATADAIQVMREGAANRMSGAWRKLFGAAWRDLAKPVLLG